MNATKLNLPAGVYRETGMVKQERQIKKLKPWLDKIRQFKKFTSIVKVNRVLGSEDDDDLDEDDDSDPLMQHEELKRVKLLKIIKERITMSGS